MSSSRPPSQVPAEARRLNQAVKLLKTALYHDTRAPLLGCHWVSLRSLFLVFPSLCRAASVACVGLRILSPPLSGVPICYPATLSRVTLNFLGTHDVGGT